MPSDVSKHDRVPEPMTAWRNRFEAHRISPEEVLHQVQVDQLVLEEYRPLSLSLEWELSQLYWASAGVLAFVEGEVPFVINNTGRLSENAARVFFANCEESAPAEGVLTVLELGAGTGLFARFFLDAFRALCEAEGKAYYERLRYLVSDHSACTVAHWRERALFDAHAERVLLGVCDAKDPVRFQPLDGEPFPLESPRAIFANYLLDVLPAAVVRKGPDGAAQQLFVRTRLTQDPTLLSQYTDLPASEIRTLAAAREPSARARLLPLVSLFDLEVDFRPVEESLEPWLEEGLAWGEGLERVLLNHGALRCLERALTQLASGGFVLINDYGAVERREVAAHGGAQRFGATTALGLNFPFLEHHFRRLARVVDVPEGDESRALHARLLLAGDAPRTRAAFASCFSARAYEHFEAPIEQARRHVTAGRMREALDAYHTALSRAPRDWYLLGEVAEFVASELKDPASALELCRAGLEHNPCFSAWLWNILGDCLYVLERYEEAHEAYLQAQRIDPHDGRTNLNLAYTYVRSRDYERALEVLSRGLLKAHKNAYRDRLLDKQREVLGLLTSRAEGEAQRLLRRNTRFA